MQKTLVTTPVTMLIHSAPAGWGIDHATSALPKWLLEGYAKQLGSTELVLLVDHPEMQSGFAYVTYVDHSHAGGGTHMFNPSTGESEYVRLVSYGQALRDIAHIVDAARIDYKTFATTILKTRRK